MSHWPIIPILIPFAAAIILLLGHNLPLVWTRAVSLGAMLALAAAAAYCVGLADSGEVFVYYLGNWLPPYGIVLVLDHLSALMVALTIALSLPALVYAMAGIDAEGRHFHALFHFQIVGLNGAFLTGDIFNLFVFFEILLLASYVLLVHGGGVERVRAGLAYVVLNLAGSALFLIALGLIYGTLGTLNLADMASVLTRVPSADQALVRTAGSLLLVVFALKAALLPVSLWLPQVYGAASPPIAALFAIMTKVGLYAILRVSAIAFDTAPFAASLLDVWLPRLALLTIVLGTIGLLAAKRLSIITANLILVSTGTLLVAVAAGTVNATAAALYYLPHTTLVTGGLFLLAGRIASQRGSLLDLIERGPWPTDILFTGGSFLVLAMAVAGAPPLSGFLGKIMLMRSLANASLAPAFWFLLLVTGLVSALVLARSASVYFWEPERQALVAPVKGVSRAGSLPTAALLLLAAASPLLMFAAAPLSQYARATAEQLHARIPYVSAVLGDATTIQRERRP
jgi:multicomponent K+:H+ antiporter subunit D